MTTQRAFLIVAVVAGLIAGALYHLATQRTAVVVAVEHLVPGRPIGPSDVDVRWLPPDAVPAGAVTEPGSAVGRFARGPMWPGQLLLETMLAPSSATFDSGLRPPTGYRAIAIPVAAHLALGGAIAPGARVDVIAVRDAAVDGSVSAELVTEAALVIDIRGEHGGGLWPRRSPDGIEPRERLGSVVVAVGSSDGLLIAERIPGSTFVLVLVPPIP